LQPRQRSSTEHLSETGICEKTNNTNQAEYSQTC
jgi:hypothetical protein